MPRRSARPVRRTSRTLSLWPARLDRFGWWVVSSGMHRGRAEFTQSALSSSRSERTCATVSRNTEDRWRQGADSTTVRGAWAPSATVRVNEPPFGPTVSPSFGHASASSFFAKAAYVCSLSLKASPTALTMLPV